MRITANFKVQIEDLMKIRIATMVARGDDLSEMQQEFQAVVPDMLEVAVKPVYECSSCGLTGSHTGCCPPCGGWIDDTSYSEVCVTVTPIARPFQFWLDIPEVGGE